MNVSKTLIATGIALTLSGGIAAAAFVPSTGIAALTSTATSGEVAGLSERGPGGGDLLAAAATYIGITPDVLRTELGTTKSLADVAVAHGKTRDGLIAALTTAATAQLPAFVDRVGVPTGAGGKGGPGDHGRGQDGATLAAAATYLGLSTADLQTKLAAGQTPAAVAAATAGKSRDGLIAALVADGKAKIDAAKAAGTLTADQAAARLTELSQHATEFADATKGQERTARLAAAATYLGLSTTDLQTKLAAGQTPAAIAAATAGKSRDGLIAAIVADGKAKIDAAKAAGTLTADQATEELAELADHATKFADSTGGPRRP